MVAPDPEGAARKWQRLRSLLLLWFALSAVSVILSMWWLEMGAVAGILGVAGASISVMQWPADLDLAVSVGPVVLSEVLGIRGFLGWWSMDGSGRVLHAHDEQHEMEQSAEVTPGTILSTPLAACGRLVRIWSCINVGRGILPCLSVMTCMMPGSELAHLVSPEVEGRGGH